MSSFLLKIHILVFWSPFRVSTHQVLKKGSSSGMEGHNPHRAFSDLHCYWLYPGVWNQNPLVAIFPSIKGYKTVHGSLHSQTLRGQPPAYLSRFILHCLSPDSLLPRQQQAFLQLQGHTALFPSGSVVDTVHIRGPELGWGEWGILHGWLLLTMSLVSKCLLLPLWPPTLPLPHFTASYLLSS